MLKNNNEVKIKESNFQSLCQLVSERAGINFTADKKNYFIRRVLSRVKSLNFKDTDEYVIYLLGSDKSKIELDKLIENLVVAETYLFRNQEQFELLKDIILPPLIEYRTKRHLRRFRAWSAGCATGEEPVSMAITFAEVVSHPELWDSLILATDISQNYIDKAKQVQFDINSFRSLNPKHMTQYFLKSQSDSNQFITHPRIKRMIRFSKINLLFDEYPSEMDIIFCRNVLIYFKQATISKIINNLKKSLRIGGVLFLGSSESMINHMDNLELIKLGSAYAYRRLK